MTLSFFVRGTPRPGGSKTAMPIYNGDGTPRTKLTAAGKQRPVFNMIDAGRNDKWAEAVGYEAKRAMRAANIGFELDEALSAEFHFYVTRPQKHFRKDGTLKPGAPQYPTSKPDVLKLARSTEDALTGIVWRDDAANVRMTLAKSYAGRENFAGEPPEGVAIRITTLAMYEALANTLL